MQLQCRSMESRMTLCIMPTISRIYISRPILTILGGKFLVSVSFLFMIYLPSFTYWIPVAYYAFSPHRFTVPVLWDKKLHTIVNNESSEIIRIFNSAFNEFLPANKAALDYYPEELRTKIDEINDLTFANINGVSMNPLCLVSSSILSNWYDILIPPHSWRV